LTNDENHDTIVPDYHVLKSNCECVAVWCKTGVWTTLQGSSALHLTAAGQVKSVVTVGAYASAQQVTVPAAGLWGYFGFTTQVSLLSTQPLLLSLLATYSIASIGGSIMLTSMPSCMG